MTEAAIISGSLVDVRNVGTHKSVKLTIHVPEEYATKVVAAFGWPTGVNPVHVAIARLNENKTTPQQQGSQSSQARQDARSSEGDGAAAENSVRQETSAPRPAPVESVTALPGGAGKKSPAQIAGYLCTLPLFQKFLQERFSNEWYNNQTRIPDLEKIAAACIYDICTVTSRTQLTDKNTEWHALQLAFRLWENHPELEDA